MWPCDRLFPSGQVVCIDLRVRMISKSAVGVIDSVRDELGRNDHVHNHVE